MRPCRHRQCQKTHYRFRSHKSLVLPLEAGSSLLASILRHHMQDRDTASQSQDETRHAITSIPHIPFFLLSLFQKRKYIFNTDRMACNWPQAHHRALLGCCAAPPKGSIECRRAGRKKGRNARSRRRSRTRPVAGASRVLYITVLYCTVV